MKLHPHIYTSKGFHHLLKTEAWLCGEGLANMVIERKGKQDAQKHEFSTVLCFHLVRQCEVIDPCPEPLHAGREASVGFVRDLAHREEFQPCLVMEGGITRLMHAPDLHPELIHWLIGLKTSSLCSFKAVDMITPRASHSEASHLAASAVSNRCAGSVTMPAASGQHAIMQI